MPADFPYEILNVVSHRPWPMPESPWVMTQSWHDLLFAHWPLAVGQLRPLLPSGRIDPGHHTLMIGGHAVEPGAGGHRHPHPGSFRRLEERAHPLGHLR